MERKGGITGTGLKIIAMTAMFIDHFSAILITDYLVNVLPYGYTREWLNEHPDIQLLYRIMRIMRLIGRFGFPLFAFLIVEGFQHTSSVKKYAIRLGLFALISEIPFNLGFASKLFNPRYQNVFFTLVLGLLCITCMHYLSEKKMGEKVVQLLFYLAAVLFGPFVTYMLWNDFATRTLLREYVADYTYILPCISGVLSLIILLWLGAKWDVTRRSVFSGNVLAMIVFCAIAHVLHTDYGSSGVLTIVILYLLRNHRMLAFFAACVELSLHNVSEFTTLFMLFPVALYNGERGKGINKYIFYAFYPVHILALYLVTLLLGFTSFAIQ